jgi:hypothetical protein
MVYNSASEKDENSGFEANNDHQLKLIRKGSIMSPLKSGT